MTADELRTYANKRYTAFRDVEAPTSEKQAGAVVEVFRALYEVAAQLSETNRHLAQLVQSNETLANATDTVANGNIRARQ